MLTITISDEILTEAIEKTLAKLLQEDNYSNPLKQLIEKQIGSSYSVGVLTPEINKKITEKVTSIMEGDSFDALLGKAIAETIAKREIKDKK